MKFEVRKHMHAIGFTEAFSRIIAMLPDALNQIAGHADIQRTIPAVGQNVYGGLSDIHGVMKGKGTGFPLSRE
jgi:hypothetical protein